MIQILTHKCCFGTIHLFDFEMREGRDEKWALNQIKKLYHKSYFNPSKAKGNLNFVELSKPTSWPKFNNELNFKVSRDGGYIHNPSIQVIRWNGSTWEYKLKNIGHESDFIPESKLSVN